MENNTIDQKLIDDVIEQMLLDIQSEDFTSIEELLKTVKKDVLVSFLSNCGVAEL
jgi:GH24 family phage-related lysozyme (muramidase)